MTKQHKANPSFTNSAIYADDIDALASLMNSHDVLDRLYKGRKQHIVETQTTYGLTKQKAKEIVDTAFFKAFLNIDTLCPYADLEYWLKSFISEAVDIERERADLHEHTYWMYGDAIDSGNTIEERVHIQLTLKNAIQTLREQKIITSEESIVLMDRVNNFDQTQLTISDLVRLGISNVDESMIDRLNAIADSGFKKLKAVPEVQDLNP